MTKGLRIYYYAVFGAFGGLLGWFVSQFAGLSPKSLAVGAIPGFFVGALVGASDSLLSARWRRAAVVGAMTGALSLVAGAISYWIAEELHTALKGGTLPRCLGFMIFGAAVGVAETIRGGSQASKGLIGGAMGGFVGGFVVEKSLALFGDPEWSGALGLTLLGASIGAFASLIATILMGAWVEIMDGKMKGRVYDLSKYIYSLKKNPIPAVIGSDEFKAEIYVMGDPGIAGRHASVRREEQNHVLKDLGGGTWVNGGRVEEHFLRDGDCIRVGSTSLLYREKRAEAPKA